MFAFCPSAAGQITRRGSLPAATMTTIPRSRRIRDRRLDFRWWLELRLVPVEGQIDDLRVRAAGGLRDRTICRMASATLASLAAGVCIDWSSASNPRTTRNAAPGASRRINPATKVPWPSSGRIGLPESCRGSVSIGSSTWPRSHGWMPSAPPTRPVSTTPTTKLSSNCCSIAGKPSSAQIGIGRDVPPIARQGRNRPSSRRSRGGPEGRGRPGCAVLIDGRLWSSCIPFRRIWWRATCGDRAGFVETP